MKKEQNEDGYTMGLRSCRAYIGAKITFDLLCCYLHSALFRECLSATERLACVENLDTTLFSSLYLGLSENQLHSVG